MNDELANELVGAILHLFNPANPVLGTEEVRHYLIERGLSIPPNSMKETLEQLEDLGCIRAVKWLGSTATEEHGNMTITAISSACLNNFVRLHRVG